MKPLRDLNDVELSSLLGTLWEQRRYEDLSKELDKWIADLAKPLTNRQLHTVQFYRTCSQELDKAIQAGEELLARLPLNSNDRVTECSQLGQIYCANRMVEQSIQCADEAVAWSEFKDFYVVGLGRSIVKLYFDIVATPNSSPKQRAYCFEQALLLLEDGCSVAKIVFDSGRLALQQIKDKELTRRFRNQLDIHKL